MIKGLTDIGLLRELNEDNYFFSEDGDNFVIAVADGMGGHNAGDKASDITVSAIKKFSEENDMYTDSEKKIRLAVLKANEDVFKESVSDKSKNGTRCSLFPSPCVSMYWRMTSIRAPPALSRCWRMCYLVAKRFDKIGSVALRTCHGKN